MSKNTTERQTWLKEKYFLNCMWVVSLSVPHVWMLQGWGASYWGLVWVHLGPVTAVGPGVYMPWSQRESWFQLLELWGLGCHPLQQLGSQPQALGQERWVPEKASAWCQMLGERVSALPQTCMFPLWRALNWTSRWVGGPGVWIRGSGILSWVLGRQKGCAGMWGIWKRVCMWTWRVLNMCFHKCSLSLPAETEEGEWAMLMFYVSLFLCGCCGRQCLVCGCPCDQHVCLWDVLSSTTGWTCKGKGVSHVPHPGQRRQLPRHQAGPRAAGQKGTELVLWEVVAVTMSLKKYREAIFRQGFHCFLWNPLKNYSVLQQGFTFSIPFSISFWYVTSSVLDRFVLLSTDFFFFFNLM